MRIKETKVYQFGELSEDAQDKAIDNLYNINVDFEWWDGIYMDAENIGLKIEGFYIDRGSYCKGKFTQSAEAVANAILQNYGADCDTTETAQQYIIELESLRDPYSDTNKDNKEFDPEDVDTEEIDAEFLQMLLEDYRIMLSKEYDYLTTKEAIVETINANEYEFTEDGKIA
jgi:hypothetical protein